MDRDSFIIAVFLLVCEQYDVISQQYRLRLCGFKSALKDEEIITLETSGEYLKLECDKDIFTYFRSHYLHFFQDIADMSLFVRQAANLLHVKTAIQQQLPTISRQLNDPVQAIDAFPLPVCVLTRARRDRCFPTEADFDTAPLKICTTTDLNEVCVSQDLA